MGIRDDFKLYTDGNNLTTPSPANLVPGTKGSDNGTMYTSEYFVMLKKMNLLCPADYPDYAARINQCIDKNGLLNRVPINQLDGQDSPDDYYGVANGCMEMGNTDIPRKFLWCLIKYFGCLNNVNPGSFQWRAFLARQPQLVCAVVSAAFPSLKNPLHYLVRLAAFPLYLISAAVLLVSCIGTHVGDTDSRRLAWHLGNNVSKVSLMCKFAYWVWRNRLKAAYPNEMQGVAAIYYYPQGTGANPYSKWWVT